MLIKKLCSSLDLTEHTSSEIQANFSDLFRQMTMTKMSDLTLPQQMDDDNDLLPGNTSVQIQSHEDYVNLLLFCKNLNTLALVKYNLVKFLYPLLFLFGIFGNSLCLFVMTKKYRLKSKNRNNNNFAFYLAMLCFADLAIIIFGCLREYIDEVFDVSIRSASIHSCRFFYFVCYLFSAFSSYLYAFIAWERWHAISDPIKHKQNRSNRNKKTILLIFTYCFLISLPFLYYPALNESVKPDENEPMLFKLLQKCEITNSGDILLTLLDSIIFCFIPFLISVLFSVFALFQLVKRNRSANKAPSMSRTCSGANITGEPYISR